MPSTLDWLRARDDRALVALLRARPDLTVPAPGDLTVLAGRLNTGPSVWRAMESLNQFHIQVLQGLAVLDADKRAVNSADLRKLLGKSVTAAVLDDALGKLEGLALVRGTSMIHMPSAVLAVLGPYPAGLGAPGKLTVAEAKAALADPGPDLPRHPRPADDRDPQGRDRPQVRDCPRRHGADHGRSAATGRRRDRRAAPRGRDGAAR